MAELKPCPFCGGTVEFEPTIAIYNALIKGKCLECGMVFEYQEKHEQYKLEQRNGNLPVITCFELYTRLNAPFEDVWNRRANDG